MRTPANTPLSRSLAAHQAYSTVPGKGLMGPTVSFLPVKGLAPAQKEASVPGVWGQAPRTWEGPCCAPDSPGPAKSFQMIPLPPTGIQDTQPGGSPESFCPGTINRLWGLQKCPVSAKGQCGTWIRRRVWLRIHGCAGNVPWKSPKSCRGREAWSEQLLGSCPDCPDPSRSECWSFFLHVTEDS